MESSVAIDVAKHVLGVFGVILAAGSAFGLLAQKLRIPDVAIFLLAGMALGPAAAGWVDIRSDSALNQGILIFGACYILFDDCRLVVEPGLLLSQCSDALLPSRFQASA